MNSTESPTLLWHPFLQGFHVHCLAPPPLFVLFIIYRQKCHFLCQHSLQIIFRQVVDLSHVASSIMVFQMRHLSGSFSCNHFYNIVFWCFFFFCVCNGHIRRLNDHIHKMLGRRALSWQAVIQEKRSIIGLGWLSTPCRHSGDNRECFSFNRVRTNTG